MCGLYDNTVCPYLKGFWRFFFGLFGEGPLWSSHFGTLGWPPTVEATAVLRWREVWGFQSCWASWDSPRSPGWTRSGWQFHSPIRIRLVYHHISKWLLCTYIIVHIGIIWSNMWFSHQLVMMISNHELTLRFVETEIPKMVLLGPNSDCFLSAYANLLFIHPFFSRTPDSGQPASTLQKGWSSVVGVQGQIHGYTDIIIFFSAISISP